MVDRKECVQEYQEQCSPSTETRCSTKQKEECREGYREECRLHWQDRCTPHQKKVCRTEHHEVCKPVYHKPTYQTAAHNGKQCEQVPKKECKYVQVIISNDSKGRMSPLLNSELSPAGARV